MQLEKFHLIGLKDYNMDKITYIVFGWIIGVMTTFVFSQWFVSHYGIN